MLSIFPLALHNFTSCLMALVPFMHSCSKLRSTAHSVASSAAMSRVTVHAMAEITLQYSSSRKY